MNLYFVFLLKEPVNIQMIAESMFMRGEQL